MTFKEIFNRFFENQRHQKVIHVASCDMLRQPNSAPKMLVSVEKPNHIYYLDYKFTKTYANLSDNDKLSVSLMSEATFTGYRLNGVSQCVTDEKEFREIHGKWQKRLIQYQADRIANRVKGISHTREDESQLPEDFFIFKFTAKEGSVVKPDRVLRSSKKE